MRAAVTSAALTAVGVVVIVLTSVATGHRAAAGPPTYGSASAGASALHVAAGVALFAAGSAAAFVRPHRLIGPLATLVGVAWFAVDWIGWTTGPEWIRTAGVALTALTALPLAWLASSLAPGGYPPRSHRIAITAASAFTVTAALVRLTVYDPLYDLDCWANCTANSLLLHRDSALAERLAVVVAVGACGVGVLSAGSLASRFRSVTAVARRRASAVVVPAVGALVSTAALDAVRAFGVIEVPDRVGFAALHRVRACALVVLAVGLGSTLIDRLRSRRAVAALSGSVSRLGREIRLEHLLAEATVDPSLRIGYYIGSDGRFVDAGGAPFEATAGRERATTTVVRNGDAIAVIDHDGSRVDHGEVARVLGPAARLALDNERLRATALAQIAELRRSRERIVAATDSARRRLERDLHDGAQQRLLAASYAARLAASEARGAGDHRAAGVAERLVDGIQRALADVRSLAHGIHPVVLTEAGLVPAVRTLSTTAPIPVEIVAVPHRRPGQAAEAAAYAMIADAVDLVSAHGGSYATVSIGDRGEELTIEIEHDAPVPAAGWIDIADRVGATGGVLDTDGSIVSARVPCAS